MPDLFGRQRGIVDCDEPNRAFPRRVIGSFIAENECKGVFPVGDGAADHLVDVRDQLTIDIDPAAFQWIVGCNNVLKGRLQYFVG